MRVSSRGACIAMLLCLAACSGSASTVERSVEIAANDDLSFDPATLNVAVGETIEFVITNSGAIDHEFVLGPESVQSAHQDATSGAHGGMHVEGQLAALELSAGETQRVTVTFEDPGEVIYGCHIAGHYSAGMRGVIEIRN